MHDPAAAQGSQGSQRQPEAARAQSPFGYRYLCGQDQWEAWVGSPICLSVCGARDPLPKGHLTLAREASAPRLAGCCARAPPGPPPRAPPPPARPPGPPRAAGRWAARSLRSRRGAAGCCCCCSAAPAAAPARRCSPAPESRLLKFHTTSVCSSSTMSAASSAECERRASLRAHGAATIFRGGPGRAGCRDTPVRALSRGLRARAPPTSPGLAAAPPPAPLLHHLLLPFLLCRRRRRLHHRGAEFSDGQGPGRHQEEGKAGGGRGEAAEGARRARAGTRLGEGAGPSRFPFPWARVHNPTSRALGRELGVPGLGKGPLGTRALSRGRGLEEEPRAAWGGEGEGRGGGEGSRQTAPQNRRGNKVRVRKAGVRGRERESGR